MKRYVLWCYYLVKATVLEFGKNHSTPHNNIIVFGSSLLGDFIMSLPALKLIRKCYPSYRIILLTRASPSMQQLNSDSNQEKSALTIPWLELAQPHLVDDAIVMEYSHPSSLLRDIRPLIQQLNPKYCFLLTFQAVSIFGLWKKIVLLKFLGVSCSVWGARRRRPLLSMKQSQYNEGFYRHHVVGRVRSVLQSPIVAELKNIDFEFDLKIPLSALAVATNLWNQHGFNTKTVIAIAPGSIKEHKQWPIENFQKVCEYLLTKEQHQILVIGMPGHHFLGEELTKMSPERVLNLAGAHSISVIAAILQRCALLIGNDGGAIHLGDSVGCRVVSIVSGIEYPFSVEPWHNVHHAVRHQVQCAPCYDFRKCPKSHNRCIKDLPVNDVLRKIDQAMNLSETDYTELSLSQQQILKKTLSGES